jgi:DNA-binding response OmpR family regulator
LGKGKDKTVTTDDLNRLRIYLDETLARGETRLPPEPRLSETLGITRGRLRTLLRRHRGAVAREVHTVEDLTLDTATLQVTRGGQSLALTPIGLKLLTALMRASPRVVSRQQLEREVWGDLLPDSDTLRSHLYTLRKAIDKPFARPLLHTLPGAGYRLAADDER